MNLNEVKNELLKGHLVTMAVNPGRFCPAGYTHQILLHSYDGKGNVFVEDPLNPSNRIWYPLSKLFEQKSTAKGDRLYPNDPLSVFFVLQ